MLQPVFNAMKNYTIYIEYNSHCSILPAREKDLGSVPSASAKPNGAMFLVALL